ncbi:MAG: hypothetical protein VKN72_28685, partial [Nostocales cyanobacterium 94392]|nr:hypothetical protein [Nostocales cyanobacterium 94392]
MWTLPIAITCGLTTLGPLKVDKWQHSVGGAVCTEVNTNHKLKVLLPPDKGTLQLVNRDIILTQFDFNPSFEEGWFLFKKTVNKVTDIPTIDLDNVKL